MKILLTLVAAATAVAPLPAQTSARAVLVTGATSGIGRTITERLSRQGFFVYAGARSAKDISELSALPNVQGVRLDVTSLTDIATAVEEIRRGGRGLYGLVNNAGILVIAPLIEASDKDIDDIFGVNVYGPLRVTRAFAPLPDCLPAAASSCAFVLISSLGWNAPALTASSAAA